MEQVRPNNNNQGGKNNDRHNQQKSFKLTESLVDVEPVGVVYNLTSKIVEDFTMNYLANTKHIDGVDGCRVVMEKGQAGTDVISVYLFINQRSNDVNSKEYKVNSIIREKISNSTYTTSQNLQSALGRICRDSRLIAGKGRGLLVAKGDIFKILAMMLAVDPYRHEIQIMEMARTGKGVILTAIKKERVSEGEGKDKYMDIINRIR